MKGLYISRVKIKNYRNFKNVDVRLQHKQIIIGENNVGKTNFIRALQLIFDSSFSDDDRNLQESDFNNTLENPMDNGEEIRIDAYISDYLDNKNIVAALSDATYVEDNKEYLLITYRFYKHQDSRGNYRYIYKVYMGNKEDNLFTQYERKYLNLKVIKALRDVESEIKNAKRSPINKALENYSFSPDDLNAISKSYKTVGSEVLKLEEIDDLVKNLNCRFKRTMGTDDYYLSLQAVDVDPNRVLSSLKLLIDNRMPNDNSLGLNNILYITFMLYLLRDKTIPSYLVASKYEELIKNDPKGILKGTYDKTEKGNYSLKNELTSEQEKELYSFMSDSDYSNEGVTLLAIEEPEAHLHPINQRLIYRDVINNDTASVILTTHSTHITAVAPLESIVNLHFSSGETLIDSSANIAESKKDFLDVKRYLDVKRGEIFLGKGVILVEGIAEEYLIPRMADLMGLNLDEEGIVLCNINSTNFYPFVRILKELHIPFAVITDGDHYYVDNGERIYHTDFDINKYQNGFSGVERIQELCSKIGIDINQKDGMGRVEMQNNGFFIGDETLEVDIMSNSKNDSKALEALLNAYKYLGGNGIKEKRFEEDLYNCKYWECLKRIDSSGMGKGRFAQVLTDYLVIENIPVYISNAIKYICEETKK